MPKQMPSHSPTRAVTAGLRSRDRKSSGAGGRSIGLVGTPSTLGSVASPAHGSAPYEVVTGPDADWSRARLVVTPAAPSGPERGRAGAGRSRHHRGGGRQ